jgi:hypothetical protein
MDTVSKPRTSMRLNVPEANKVGNFPIEPTTRIARVLPVFSNTSGSVTHNKAKRAGFTDEEVMQAVAIKETGNRDTKRGYAFHFDDSTAQAEYKAKAMRKGNAVAHAVAVGREMEKPAVPRYIRDFTTPTLNAAEAAKTSDDLRKDRDVAAAAAVMQDKMKGKDTLERGLRKWRSLKEEPEYPDHVKAIAKNIRTAY